MKPKCKLCGERHWTYEAHLTSASNRVKVHLTASNKEVMPGGASVRGLEPEHGTPAVVVATAPSAGKHQRWDREKYRAYQREYMRRRRGN